MHDSLRIAYHPPNFSNFVAEVLLYFRILLVLFAVRQQFPRLQPRGVSLGEGRRRAVYLIIVDGILDVRHCRLDKANIQVIVTHESFEEVSCWQLTIFTFFTQKQRNKSFLTSYLITTLLYYYK